MHGSHSAEHSDAEFELAVLHAVLWTDRKRSPEKCAECVIKSPLFPVSACGQHMHSLISD